MPATLHLLALCLLLCPLTINASTPREHWLIDIVQTSNPVREQLAMLSHPEHPLSIRVYSGTHTPCGKRACVRDHELALSETLMDELQQLAIDTPEADRWSLLFVLSYLAAYHAQGPRAEPAYALLQAANHVLATAWEAAGRPHRNGLRAQMQRDILVHVPYADALRQLPTLHTDADGFLMSPANVRVLRDHLQNSAAGQDF